MYRQKRSWSQEVALKKTDASGKLGRWCLRLSELVLNIVHRVDTKHHAIDTLSRLSTVKSHKTKLNDEIPALIINPKIFGAADSVWSVPQEEEAGDYSTPRRNFITLLQEHYAVASKSNESTFKITHLYKHIAFQTANSECHLAAKIVGQLKTLFSYGADVVLIGWRPYEYNIHTVQEQSLWFPSRRRIKKIHPAVPIPCVVRQHRYSLMKRHPASDECTTLGSWIFNRHTCRTKYMTLYKSAACGREAVVLRRHNANSAGSQQPDH